MNGSGVPGCSGKIKHGTQASADAAAERTGQKHGRNGQASAYPCRNCGCWHVTTLHGAALKRDERARAERNRDRRPMWERVYRPMPGAPFEWPGE